MNLSAKKLLATASVICLIGVPACKPKNAGNAVSADAALKAYMLLLENMMSFITSFQEVLAVK